MAQAYRASAYALPPDNPENYAVRFNDAGTPQGSPQYVLPLSPAYATPGDDVPGRSGYWDNSGYAVQLRESPIGVPDTSRMGDSQPHETRAGANADTPLGVPDLYADRYERTPIVNPTPYPLAPGSGSEVARERAVEFQNPEGFEELKQSPSFYQRPRPSDTGEPRPTTRLSPHTYIFTRPFPGMGTFGHLNGLHFSAADHRRDYPILGMAPVMWKRNTYRQEPEPWDSNMGDVPPPDDGGAPDYQIQSANVPLMGGPSQSWRLTT